MVDGVLTADKTQKGIMMARMKVGMPAYQPQPSGLTDAESRLADILDIGSAVQDRAQKTRRLDGFLRFFQSFLRFINSDPANISVKPQISPIDIDYVRMDNPYAVKTDKTV